MLRDSPQCAEKYIISAGEVADRWVPAGHPQTRLTQFCPLPPGEMGPTVLVPDGRVFAIGATGSTGLYIPPANPTDPGIWAGGATLLVSVGGTLQTMFPMVAPAALLPNGKVFSAGSPGPVCSILAKDYNGPTNFFEYDYTTNKATPITSNAAGGT